MAQVEMNTRWFQFSHGRQPRGTGVWMFEVNGDVVTFTGSFTEAARQARQVARSVGAREVVVCP